MGKLNVLACWVMAGASLAGAGCVESAQILEYVEDAGTGGVIDSEGAGGTSLGGMGGLSPGPIGVDVLVDAGDAHTCGIVDGELYCWGNNSNGALGLGDVAARSVPTRVGTEDDWVTVVAAGESTCALRAGRVSCWGAGANGQIGNGEFSSTVVPTAISLPGSVNWLDASFDHACVVMEDGRLYCWGNNSEGQLGQGDPFPGPGVDSAVPIQVGSDSDWSAVACGQGHTCALRVDGTLYCWGRNANHELGLGEGAEGQIRTPQQVGTDMDWEQIVAGQNHSCAVKANGDLWCWGENVNGQFGVPEVTVSPTPTVVPLFGSVRQFSADTFHACAVDQSGALACVGRNVEGQLGSGNLESTSEPTSTLPAEGWSQISSGRFHTCGVRAGSILCTGENQDGRLGTGDLLRRQEFVVTVF